MFSFDYVLINWGPCSRILLQNTKVTSDQNTPPFYCFVLIAGSSTRIIQEILQRRNNYFINEDRIVIHIRNNSRIMHMCAECRIRDVHVSIEEYEDFECGGTVDTGGKMEQTRCLSQQVMGNIFLYICIYFFRFIRIWLSYI